MAQAMTAPLGAMKITLTPAPIFTKIAYYIHYVSESEWRTAISFFRDTLGLKPRFDAATAEPGWAEFEGGGITLALHSAEQSPAPRETGIVFGVPQCDEAAATLRARGVDGITAPHQVCDEGRCFSFKDPFGNTFSAYGK